MDGTGAGLQEYALDELGIDDEPSFRHVGLYAKLKTALKRHNARFAVCSGGLGRAQLLNLAFWQPDGWVEALPEPFVSADQVMHNAWHVLVAHALGAAASSGAGMLLAESVASAFDIYLVGRLVGHSPDSDFLCTQVPAMREAALDAGQSDAAFATLLEACSASPEACFEEFRSLLFGLSLALVDAPNVDVAEALLRDRCNGHRFGCWVHHYELPTWVLQARAAGTTTAQREQVLSFDRSMREAADAMAWLEQHWVDAGS